MVYVIAPLIVLLVVVVAFGFVGREAGRLEEKPRIALFDINEAVEFVADELPSEVSAILSYDDVRRILMWNLEYLKANSMTANGKSAFPPQPVVVSGPAVAEFVMEKAATADAEYTAEQIYAVLDAQMAYLQNIGAVGAPATPDPGELPDDPFAGETPGQ